MPEAAEPDPGSGRRGHPLTDQLVEVLDASLELGASLARSLAGATGSRDIAPAGERPIDDILTYGTATASNLLHLVTDGASQISRSGAAPAPPPAGVGPMVTVGSTLRVPLLVENTGQTPTRALTFQADSVLRADCPDGDTCTCIPVEQVRFAPETLVVSPRDFEKLTVRIAAPTGTPPGAYRASISAGEGWFSTVIGFTVLAS